MPTMSEINANRRAGIGNAAAGVGGALAPSSQERIAQGEEIAQLRRLSATDAEVARGYLTDVSRLRLGGKDPDPEVINQGVGEMNYRGFANLQNEWDRRMGRDIERRKISAASRPERDPFNFADEFRKERARAQEELEATARVQGKQEPIRTEDVDYRAMNFMLRAHPERLPSATALRRAISGRVQTATAAGQDPSAVVFQTVKEWWADPKKRAALQHDPLGEELAITIMRLEPQMAQPDGAARVGAVLGAILGGGGGAFAGGLLGAGAGAAAGGYAGAKVGATVGEAVKPKQEHRPRLF